MTGYLHKIMFMGPSPYMKCVGSDSLENLKGKDRIIGLGRLAKRIQSTFRE